MSYICLVIGYIYLVINCIWYIITNWEFIILYKFFALMLDELFIGCNLIISRSTAYLKHQKYGYSDWGWREVTFHPLNRLPYYMGSIRSSILEIPMFTWGPSSVLRQINSVEIFEQSCYQLWSIRGWFSKASFIWYERAEFGSKFAHWILK